MRLKIECARRQLGTALHLYLKGVDPVSVHVLACGAGEILHHYADKTSTRSLTSRAVDLSPEMKVHKALKVRRGFWNAFKHATEVYRKGHQIIERDDEDLISAFSEENNINELLIAWTDYVIVTGQLPVEAQAFHIWAYARKELLDAQSEKIRIAHRTFPKLFEAPYETQRFMLKRSIAEWREDQTIMGDPGTEKRPLLLRWPA